MGVILPPVFMHIYNLFVAMEFAVSDCNEFSKYANTTA